MMKYDTPLRKFHASFASELATLGEGLREETRRTGAAVGHREAAGRVEFLPYGPADQEGEPICEILATFGAVEAEYAAIRRGAGLFDCAHRGTLIVTGSDRRDFLNNMLTQELKSLAPGLVREGFLLNRQGRIEADLRLMEFGEFTLIDVDVHQIQSTVDLLNAALFLENVQIKIVDETFHHLEIHGPRALEVLQSATDQGALELEPHRAVSLALGDDAELFVARIDQTGEVGLILIVPRARVAEVWRTLVQSDATLAEGKRRIRPIGWYAFNIARIEAGSPMFNIDFGLKNLPHETGILASRVSFTKGCYPGQEVVARMQNLGQPKQKLVGLRMKGEHLPLAGMPVYESVANRDGDACGQVTSSTISPMLGSTPIALAMLRNALTTEGAVVQVEAEGELVDATVQGLRFLPDPPDAGAGAS